MDDANTVCEVGERWVGEKEKEKEKEVGEGTDKKRVHLLALCDLLNVS